VLTAAGIVGSGGVGRLHVDALRRLGVRVVGVAAATAELAARDAAELGLEPQTAFASAEALIQSPAVSVVHVCTPNALHAEHCRAALAAGKHVVVEKPLTTSSDEAERLLAQAEGAGVTHVVCHNYRYYTMVQALRSLVARGELGHVRTVRATWLLEELLTLDAEHWMFDRAQMGPALALADVGVHLWDLVEHVIDERIAAVMCETQVARSHATASGEDTAAVLLRCTGDVLVDALVSQAVPGHGNTVVLEVVGERASAEWDIRAPDRLVVRGRGGRHRVLERGTAEVTALGVRSVLPHGQPEGHADATRALMARVYGAIAGDGDAEHPTFADGVRGLRTLGALLASARDRRWTTVRTD
jgi:predicted dehydrogenase